MSRRLNVSARLALSRIDGNTTSSEQLQLSSHICVLERNHFTCWTLKGVRICCWDVQMDVTENSSKLLDTEGRSRRKVLVVRTDDARQMSVRTKYHVVQTDARELNYTVLNYAQCLLEAYNWSIDFEYNSIPV
jgi:hypothetical protein